MAQEEGQEQPPSTGPEPKPRTCRDTDMAASTPAPEESAIVEWTLSPVVHAGPHGQEQSWDRPFRESTLLTSHTAPQASVSFQGELCGRVVRAVAAAFVTEQGHLASPCRVQKRWGPFLLGPPSQDPRIGSGWDRGSLNPGQDPEGGGLEMGAVSSSYVRRVPYPSQTLSHIQTQACQGQGPHSHANLRSHEGHLNLKSVS